MKRLSAMYQLAVGARWGSLVLVSGILWYTGAFVRLGTQVGPLIWLIYAALYAVLWTRVLPRLLARASYGSPVVLYDLLLSLLPVWWTGGWTSIFVPFALSALVAPTLARGWRGGLPVAACFLALDQLILWTTAATPWEIASSGLLSSLALIIRTLVPFGVVFGIVGALRLGRWLGRQTRRRPTPSTPRQEFSSVQSLLQSSGVDPGTAYTRSSGANDQPTRAWGKERASQQTIERRKPVSIQAALQHCAPDLRTANLTMTLQLDGDEQQLPPQIRELLIRATEVALDNVISHAHARTVRIELRIQRDSAALHIADDGIGLFDGTAEPPGFHQLKRLRFRAEELGGELRVTEREEGGVALDLHVPFTR